MVLAGDFIRDSSREDVAEARGGAGGAEGGGGRGGAVEGGGGVRLDGGVLHLHCALWWGRGLGVRGGGHHDGAGVGALLLRCEGGEGGEGGVAGAGVVDECYAEHLGLAPWCWWCLLHLLEAGTTDGLRWWRWGR